MKKASILFPSVMLVLVVGLGSGCDLKSLISELKEETSGCGSQAGGGAKPGSTGTSDSGAGGAQRSVGGGAVDYTLVDLNGDLKEPGPVPFADGDHLQPTQAALTPLRRAHAHAWRLIAPIRQVLLHAPRSVSDDEWKALAADVAEYGVSVERELLDYARAGTHAEEVRSRFEAAELALKCRLFADTRLSFGTSIDMAGADGHDHCLEVLGLRTQN